MVSLARTAALLLGLLPAIAVSQTLCDVTKITRNLAKLEFALQGSKSLRVVQQSEGKQIEYIFENGILVGRDGSKAAIISAEKDSIVYVHEKLDRTCVIRPEERDGQLGLYIEELISTAGRPPRYQTEFIELN